MATSNFCLLLMFLSGVVASGQVSSNKGPTLTTDGSTLSFCELINNPGLYDAKEVEVRAKYVSTFEVSALTDENCADTGKRMWVEFDRASIKAASNAVVLKKLDD